MIQDISFYHNMYGFLSVYLDRTVNEKSAFQIQNIGQYKRCWIVFSFTMSFFRFLTGKHASLSDMHSSNEHFVLFCIF